MKEKTMETLNNKNIIIDDTELSEINDPSLNLKTWEKERSEEDLDNFLASRFGALGLNASDFELVA